MRLRARFAAAWAALWEDPLYVVIYDVEDRSTEHSIETEEYYGYFDTEAHAEKMFNQAFPVKRYGGAVHNAYICRRGRQLREDW